MLSTSFSLSKCMKGVRQVALGFLLLSLLATACGGLDVRGGATRPGAALSSRSSATATATLSRIDSPPRRPPEVKLIHRVGDEWQVLQAGTIYNGEWIDENSIRPLPSLKEVPWPSTVDVYQDPMLFMTTDAIPRSLSLKAFTNKVSPRGVPLANPVAELECWRSDFLGKQGACRLQPLGHEGAAVSLRSLVGSKRLQLRISVNVTWTEPRVSDRSRQAFDWATWLFVLQPSKSTGLEPERVQE